MPALKRPSSSKTLRSVAVIGSTGGSTSFGDARPFLQALETSLRRQGAHVTHALTVSCDKGLTTASENDQKDVTLYQVHPPPLVVEESSSNSSASEDECDLEEDATFSEWMPLPCVVISKGSLQEANALCRQEERKIAAAIQKGSIDALICLSCQADVFRETLKAASASTNLVVVGSGRRSVALLETLHRLTVHQGPEPHLLRVVTDPVLRAAYYVEGLEAAGWKQSTNTKRWTKELKRTRRLYEEQKVSRTVSLSDDNNKDAPDKPTFWNRIFGVCLGQPCGSYCVY